MLMTALKESVKAVTTRPVTGDGSTPICGRGLKHRKLSQQGRIALAADIATGSRPYVPALAEICAVLGVPVPAVRAEIKARAAVNGNGGTDNLTVMTATLVHELGLDAAFDRLLLFSDR
jgi:hypothetical protein